MTVFNEDSEYDGTGKLGQALQDFKYFYCSGQTKQWPRFWKEFAAQAFADLIALEVQIPRKRKKKCQSKQ